MDTVASTTTLTDGELQRLYSWIDEIPLSRAKRHIGRDFADGVLTAEVVAYYFPRLVELHNYPPASSTQQKLYNWDTLNTRVLRKLGYNLPRGDIDGIITSRPGCIERVLHNIQHKMVRYRQKKASQERAAAAAPEAPEAGAAAAPAGPSGGSTAPASSAASRHPSTQEPRDMRAAIDAELLVEKEQAIQDLTETVEILELKAAKLEQLVRLKDPKIARLQQQVQALSEPGL